VAEYIQLFPPEVQVALGKIRAIVQRIAPEAVEKISYRMPSFSLDSVVTS
jgi:uncharacterized protein YdhG (YjbR/CyaY superfamily)